MNKLQLQVQRLYVPRSTGGPDTGSDESRLIDSSGRVRAMVLELAGPADWVALSKVWQGVQVDLELPAPAIAVNGNNGYQLWFSLSEPVPAPRARVFLESLRVRYLGDIKPHRVGLMPAFDASSPPPVQLAGMVPELQAESGHWSAFVAPDLAPVFADEPWLDIPPNLDGQSDLLSRLESIPPADFERALERLGPATVSARSRPAAGAAAVAAAVGSPMATTPTAIGPCRDPKRFLLDVMNDETVALSLRIEAAKALLPYADDPRPH